MTCDRYMRFIPIEELTVEWFDNDTTKDPCHTWQLIQTDCKTRLKTCFRFSNR
jgi:hypothetical protein